ncbi:uncharacterized protein LOC130665659 [Microplitis mediator]|uniref:uncharacterized protein LOC130665659 n=1 Tax=Microplitis mediator TaxID=375433 RepID=UPI0025578898|nr:uncharacterized protein LOC130665659 [Microplitis mediator]
MEDEYATIVYAELAPNIFVPTEWPIQGLEDLIVTLAKRIIARFNVLSPIVQVKNIPTRLIRRVYVNNSGYFFQKVSKKEMIGAYVYNIVPPKKGDEILIEINSGSNIDHESCQNNPVEVPSEVNMTSSSLVPSRFSEETSRNIDDNEHTSRRCLSRKIKRLVFWMRQMLRYQIECASAIPTLESQCFSGNKKHARYI